MAEQDRIDVVFGAQIGGLVAGVAEVKSVIEGLRDPIDSFVKDLRGIGEAIGVAFAVEKVREFIHEIGELALRTEVLSEVLGTTPQEVQKLNTEFELLTGQAELPARAFEMLGNNIVSGSKRSQAALRDLLISQQDATRMTTDWEFALRRLARAWQENEGGMARTADLAALVGRRHVEDLIPVLTTTAKEFDEIGKKAEEVGTILTGPQMAAMRAEHTALNELKTTFDALTKQSMAAFAQDLTGIIGILTKLVSAITPAISWLERLALTFSLVGNAAAAAGRLIEQFQNIISPLPEASATAVIPPDIKHVPKGPGTEKSGAKKESDDRMEVWRDELRQKLEAERNFFADSKKEELEYWQAKLATVQGGSKQDVRLRREINTEIFNLEKQLARQTEQDAIAEVDYKSRVGDLLIDRRKAQIESDLAMGKVSAQRALELEQGLVDEKLVADQNYYREKEDAAAGDVREITKLERQEYLDHEKLMSQRIALDNKMAEERQKEFQSAAQTIAQPLTGAISGIVSGRETAGQAFAKAGQDIMQKVMDNLAEKLIERMIINLFQQIASDVANTGILAGLLTLLNAKPSVAGTTYGLGGIVPSAAGGWVIPSFQSGGTLAQLHSGEMVLPKDLSEGVQSSIRGGGGLGGGVNLTVNAWDTQTGAQALMKNSQSVAGAMRSGWMQGGTSMRAMSSGGRYP